VSKVQHEYQTFLSALEQLHANPLQFNKYFSDKRLSFSEKKILQAWLCLKKSDFSSVIAILNTITTSDYPLVTVQKNLLLAVVSNNFGEFKQAFDYLEQALIQLDRAEYPEMSFTVYFNYFITAANACNVKKMKMALTELEVIAPNRTHQKLALKESQFTYYAYIESYQLAEKYLIELEAEIKHMTPANLMSFLISKFIYLINTNNMNQARHTLNKLKKIRSYRLSSNYIYMKSLLDHLMDGTSIYLYDYQFKDNLLLFYQSQVIRFLSERDIEQAHSYWSKLAKFNQHHYQDNFHYAGEKGLFSRCLAKHQLQLEQTPIKTSKNISKSQLIIEYLIKANGPVNKEILFEWVWGRKVNHKDELRSLSALISKIKSRQKIQITYKNNCYELMKKKVA
jgi:hypothetical protein